MASRYRGRGIELVESSTEGDILMKSEQYEELARLFIAEEFGLDLEAVRSERAEGPSSPGRKPVVHQVDLKWETGGELAAYLHIANAKWRTSGKVDQGDVLLLEQVRNLLSAHKAMMITNTGFTEGAMNVAEQLGIALHILKPDFEKKGLPVKDRTKIQEAFTRIKEERNGPIYTFQVEHRDGLHAMRETATLYRPTPAAGGQPSSRGYETRVQAPASHRASFPRSGTGRYGGETRGGPPPSGGGRRGSR